MRAPKNSVLSRRVCCLPSEVTLVVHDQPTTDDKAATETLASCMLQLHKESILSIVRWSSGKHDVIGPLPAFRSALGLHRGLKEIRSFLAFEKDELESWERYVEHA